MAKHSIGQALALARAHLESGRLAEAETICRLVVETDSEQSEALVIWAAACGRRGDLDAAAQHLQKACNQQPSNASLWKSLAGIWEKAGKWGECETAARQALELAPDDPFVENSLANALQAQERFDEAEAEYRRALAIAPKSERIWSNLGTLLQRQGRFAEAEQAYRRSLEIEPLQAYTHNNLGTILRVLGRAEESEAAYRRALELRPMFAEAEFNLGCLLQSVQKLADAEAAYLRALAISPAYVKAAYNLATVLDRPGRVADAEQAYRRVLALAPTHPGARLNLGNLLHNASRFDEAETEYRRAIELQSAASSAHSNLLLNQQCRPGVTAGKLLEMHRQWDQLYAAEITRAAPPPANSPDPDRPLRLGFVSSDLGRHPVGYFLVSMLESLDRERFPVFCYSDRGQEDDLSARIQATAHTWRRTAALSHEALAEQIRSDGVDLLFDLAGHTAGNRLMALARKPAPIQIDWIGYPGTTGLEAIDFVLADRHHVPPGTEQDYREQILRMPEGYVCYTPPAYAPPVGPLPARAAGYVTFASFNKPAKINPHLAALWSQILRRVPDSRLMLKYPGLDDPSVRRRYLEMLAAEGVPADRLEFSGESAHEELLKCYQRVDLALDTRPYSGGLTTCEALWMGVPVVTWPGETFASRHATSHISTAGLEGTIASGADEYIAIAVQLAGDLDRLESIRASLRQRVAGSPLCDANGFARNFQILLRDVWRAWCRAHARSVG